MCPCDCSHLEPREYERESKLVASLIVYVDSFYKGITPKWIRNAAIDCYGNEERVHQLTEILCTKIGEMSPGTRSSIVYNARSKDSRRLADWWEKHQEADRIKAQAHAEASAREAKRKAALNKLTPVERKLLGL